MSCDGQNDDVEAELQLLAGPGKVAASVQFERHASGPEQSVTALTQQPAQKMAPGRISSGHAPRTDRPKNESNAAERRDRKSPKDGMTSPKI